MFQDFKLQETLCFISIFAAVIFRMFMFSKIKKKTATKEGREYIGEKGGRTIISLEMSIFLTVLVFILVSVFNLSLIITILLQVCVWIFVIGVFRKFSK